MSLLYRTADEMISADELLERLAERGIREQVTKNTTDTFKRLTDGRNHVWVYLEDGHLALIESGMGTFAILRAIEEVFNTEIYSQYEPQFHGFKTKEEFEAADQPQPEDAIRARELAAKLGKTPLKARKVTTTEKDLALARMIATPEDDLPKA
jgi:hypothetical protein